MKPKDGGAALTDEGVAKALGWVSAKGSYGSRKGNTSEPIPHYTTSLDAITAEIEARGLAWSTCGTKDRHPNRSMVEHIIADGDTAPLALCAALLAYLKESKNA